MNFVAASHYMNIHLRLLVSFTSRDHVLPCVKGARPGQRVLDNVSVVAGVSQVPSGSLMLREVSGDHDVAILLETLNDLICDNCVHATDCQIPCCGRNYMKRD